MGLEKCLIFFGTGHPLSGFYGAGYFIVNIKGFSGAFLTALTNSENLERAPEATTIKLSRI